MSKALAPLFNIHIPNFMIEVIEPQKVGLVMVDEDVLSQANTLATLPSYIGKIEIGTKILPMPSF